MTTDQHEDLPMPHEGMTPEEKGALLVRYVRARKPTKGLDFSSAQLKGITTFEFLGVPPAGRTDDVPWAPMPYVRWAELTWADLAGVNLRGARLGGACLTHADLRDADLAGANLDGCNLEAADLRGADLMGASAQQADLHGVLLQMANLLSTKLNNSRLEGAHIEGAFLALTNLSDANLSAIDGTPRSRQGCFLNVQAFHRSRWLPELLGDWLRAGATLTDADSLPEEIRVKLFQAHEGLALFFNTRLVQVDRVLVEGIISVVLGRARANEVEVEVSPSADGTRVRLQSRSHDDLEAVATALYQRIWEMQERAQEQTLARLARGLGIGSAALGPITVQGDNNTLVVASPNTQVGGQHVHNHSSLGNQLNVAGDAYGLHADLGPIVTRLSKLQDALGGSLAELVDRLEKMELRLPTKEAVADQSADAAARRELRLVHTWDPGVHPRTALERLLASLEPDELREVLARGEGGAEMVAHLPGGPGSQLTVAVEAIDALLGRGPIDAGLFERVVAVRPELGKLVERVAGLWTDGGE